MPGIKKSVPPRVFINASFNHSFTLNALSKWLTTGREKGKTFGDFPFSLKSCTLDFGPGELCDGR